MDSAALLAWVAQRSRPAGTCRIWRNAVDKNGYPLGQLPKFVLGFLCRRQQRIGRKVCEAAYGAPPQPGMVAMHYCDTPRCVEVAHLRWGTAKENTHDSVRKGRWGSEKHARGMQTLACALHEVGFSLREVGNIIGIPKGTIGHMVLPGYRKVA